jgi:tRNA threonylcarbamoyl adenosine modification protein YeaZ
VLVLALDTSSAAILTAVYALPETGPSTELACHDAVNARGHTELLAPSIASCLTNAGISPSELDAVVAGLGPGPFTGMRVGLVTAAAMAQALSIPTYGVCSLDAIAQRGHHDLLVATDARRHEIYWARYDASGTRTDGPHVARAADVSTDGIAAMTGAGARLYQPELDRPLLDREYPDLGALVAVAADRIRSGAAGETLTPLYLRRPDAVPPAAVKAVSQ